jgi:hypothetical protein
MLKLWLPEPQEPDGSVSSFFGGYGRRKIQVLKASRFRGFSFSFVPFPSMQKGQTGASFLFYHQALFLPHCPFEKLIVNDYQGRRA